MADDEPQVIGWTCSMQDFRGRPPGSAEKPPPVIKTWFASRAEAEARKARLRILNPSPEFLLCVSPAKFKAPKLKEKPKPSAHGQMDWGSR